MPGAGQHRAAVKEANETIKDTIKEAINEAATAAMTAYAGSAGPYNGAMSGQNLSIDAPPVSDDVLLTRYLQGDQQAFETLYHRYRLPVYRFLRAQLQSHHADDVFQEIWRKVINSAARYEGDGRFSRYLFTIAHNALNDWYRSNRRFTATEAVDELTAAEQVEKTVEQDQLRARLLRLVQALPAAQRTAWLLQQEEDFSLEEIARICNSNVETIKSRLRYARDKLKAGMNS